MVSVDTSVSNANHQNCHDMAPILVYLLLPVAGLIIVWLRKDWITKSFVRFDGFYFPICVNTFVKEKLLLSWARKRLPSHWSTKSNTLADGISDFWKDGSLLCTLINSAVPGACPNPYRHWRKPPEHAQEVAFKYLGVNPIFNNLELTSSVSLYIDAKLLKYLNNIRKSIYDLEKERSACSLISSEFLARGMGLYTAEQFKSSEFFIYSRNKHGNFLNIEILIFGPYCSCIKTTVSDYIDKKVDKNRNVSKNINIAIEIEKDRLKICYSSNNTGMHVIILSCNQESIRGSPFYINVEKYEKNLFEKEISLENFEAETKADVKVLQNYTDNKITKNNEIDTENQKYISLNQNATKNNKQNVNIRNISQSYKENMFNETIKVNKISNKISDNNVVTKINNQTKSEVLGISKYLKNLSNRHEKEVNINRNIATNIAKENYSDFQKLVDSSYRKNCRITRSHPRLGQIKFAQFSYASPVCSEHIAPEDIRKLSVDSKRKMFSQKKSEAIDSGDTPINSQFSIDENKTEELNRESPKLEHNEKPIKNDEVLSNLNEFKKQRKSLQKIVNEKRLFWESAFNESNNKIQPNLTGDVESLKTFDKTLSRDLKRNNNKYVKSLDKLRKRVVSQSLHDLRTSEQIRVLRPFRSLDNSLDICCEISLGDRTKSYFENVKFATGTSANKMILSRKYGKKEKLLDDLPTTSSCEALLYKKPRSDLTPKISFRKAVEYFRNLEVGKIKPTLPNKPNNINRIRNLVLNRSDRSFMQCNGEMESRNLQMEKGEKKRKPIMEGFDVLY
ncbi:unnamed protein product [Ceutorhynchus assimilis]|uniref:Calponin-homology (CH) domain-containing protein n=1 Tax=Ceutorhynchus assimilis TaxID=467358 RepID=A0A9N9MSS8_9CUCU|nr:unnamed protein product [Ceutorhynchus assimilis]